MSSKITKTNPQQPEPSPEQQPNAGTKRETVKKHPSPPPQELTPVAETQGTHNEAQSILSSIQALSAKNAAAAQYLGEKLADAEEAFPRTMMQAYADRKAQYRAAGADTGNFLRMLEGKVRAIESVDVRAALSGVSNPLELAALPQRTGTDSHD